MTRAAHRFGMTGVGADELARREIVKPKISAINLVGRRPL